MLLVTDVPRSLVIPDVFNGLVSSFIFGLTVVEKLRPRAIDPSIRLNSSAFGLTGAVCCVKCNLLPMTNEVRGDSTSLGSIEMIQTELYTISTLFQLYRTFVI